jgi:hypothetical protein
MQQGRDSSRVVVSSVIEREQREELERRATEADRTLSAEVRRAVTAYLRDNEEEAEA